VLVFVVRGRDEHDWEICVSSQRFTGWSRRHFMSTATLVGAGAFLSLHPKAIAAEPPPETTSLRLLAIPALCWAPQYVAEDLLRAEGFSHVHYLKKDIGAAMFDAVASGEADISMSIAGPLIVRMDGGGAIIVLAGVHVGCYELFGTDRIRTIRDLKGKTVGVQGLGGGAHVTLATMLAYVGVDSRSEVKWVVYSPAESMRRLADGTIDAYMAFPPEPQELRAKKIGHIVVNTMMDKPWSQYFCCMVAANREFVRNNPVATKRALRSILRAADICAREPKRAARFLVDKGYTKNFNYALEAMKDIPYNHWRDYDPEDTLRFYSLRLQEIGMIKSSPQKIIAQGTDWRFLRELKKELKT
jgi:NitT/TauT family transport system substrate-binding protein